MIKQKVIFLDRDGVINEQAPPHEYVVEWKNFKLLPGVIDAIKIMNAFGYKIYVISNQRGIARGKCSYEQIKKLHEKMLNYLKKNNCIINDVYFCPHDVDECNCRKPEIGLFVQIENALRNENIEIDKNHSWMIGDFDTDIIAGHRYGIKTVRIITSRKESCTINIQSELYARDLNDAICRILREEL